MMLHNALDRAVKEKLILTNPTENCIIPKIEKQEMKILHPDHISSYLNAAERRNALPMFYLEPVSYTHLDVYKRQANLCPDAFRHQEERQSALYPQTNS